LVGPQQILQLSPQLRLPDALLIEESPSFRGPEFARFGK
jgi:hypothetical protein